MQILVPMHYEQHFLRRPADQWPEPVTRAFGHINQHVYTLMQGPSELGASGVLVNWDRSADLHRITVPTLVIGARYDTMDPHGWRRWRTACRTASISTARTAATWRCTTTSRPISRA